MTSEYDEKPKSYDERKIKVLGGIYRVVKEIDDKVDSMLEDLKDTYESRTENFYDPYWNPDYQNEV